jgi:hypothetical protein
MIRFDGSDRPRPVKAARTRSRLSETALSPMPTRKNFASPLVNWTCTSTRTASTPWNATVTTPAAMSCPHPIPCGQASVIHKMPAFAEGIS